MRKILFFILICLLLIGPASHQIQSENSKKPKLTLTAYPRQGFGPMRVSINGKLENVSKKDKEFYCLQEEWEFGDGAVSSEQANCEDFGDSTEVKLQFFAEHIYEEAGSYTIWLTLGDKKIRSNQIAVVVLESDISKQQGR
jgi:PKD domain